MPPSTTDHDLFARLNEPAAVGGQAGVTRYLFDVYRRREDLQRTFPDLDGPDGSGLVEWAHVHGRYEVPILEQLLPPVPERRREEVEAHARNASAERSVVPDDPRWGINLIGYLRGELGLGEAGRLLVSGLDAARIPLLPLEAPSLPHHRHGHAYATLGISAAAFETNIVCANPEGLLSLTRELGPQFFTERHSIGFWWWEAESRLPIEWQLGASLLDEVWTGSHYVAGLVGRSCSLPVRTITLPITVPRVPQINRDRLGLPDEFLFLFMFDYRSVFARKNPLAVIDAFVSVFPPGGGAALVIKTINAEHDPDSHRRLLDRAAEHPDVRIMDGYLSSQSKNALIAACDCYVSLHRSEGFGLTLAEAMYLGKPVIATGYSGNLDFMSAANSYLVNHELKEIGPEAQPYPAEGRWAEPDVEQASSFMRQVFEQPLAAKELGARAAREIRRSHSPAAAADSLSQHLQPLKGRLRVVRTLDAGPVPPLPLEQAMSLLHSDPVPPSRSLVGPVRRALRRLVLRAIRPYTAHQRRVDAELLDGLARAAEALQEFAREQAGRNESIEFRLARTQAELLAAQRRRDEILAEASFAAAAEERIVPEPSIEGLAVARLNESGRRLVPGDRNGSTATSKPNGTATWG